MIKLKIKQMRLNRGWTQRELSEKSGIDQEVISMYENNKRNPLPKNLAKLAKAFGVSVGELF